MNNCMSSGMNVIEDCLAVPFTSIAEMFDISFINAWLNECVHEWIQFCMNECYVWLRILFVGFMCMLPVWMNVNEWR